MGSQIVRHNLVWLNSNNSDKPIDSIIVNSEKLKVFPLISGTRQRYLLLILLFSVVLEVLTTEIREGKEVKGIQIGKEVKLSLFAYNMYIYIEDLKDATRKLLELINEFGKVTGYKINTEKSVAFPGYDKQKSTTIKKKEICCISIHLQ